MFPLNGSDEKESNVYEKIDDDDNIIVTPGTRKSPNTDDRNFINPNYETNGPPPE